MTLEGEPRKTDADLEWDRELSLGNDALRAVNWGTADGAAKAGIAQAHYLRGIGKQLAVIRHILEEAED